MMTLHEALELVALAPDVAGPVVELREGFAAGTLRVLSDKPGHGTAREIARDFRLRVLVAEGAGRVVVGLREVVEDLARRPPDTPVLLFHFKGARGLYSVFVDGQARELVGVSRVSS